MGLPCLFASKSLKTTAFSIGITVDSLFRDDKFIVSVLFFNFSKESQMKKKMFFLFMIFLVSFISCGDNDGKVEENDMDNVTGSDDDQAADETVDENEVTDNSDEETDEAVTDNENDLENDDADTVEKEPLKINSGTGIGGFVIGMTYVQMKEKYGDPDSPICFNRLGSAKYKDLGVEVVFASSDQYQISDDAKLLAVGAMAGGKFEGDVLPDMTRTEIEKLMKDAQKEDTGEYVYYTEGFSVQYEDDKAVIIGVYPPYELKYEVPVMEKCETTIN